MAKRLMIGVIVALAFATSAQADALYGDSNHEAPTRPGDSQPLPNIDIDTVSVSNDPSANSLTFAVRLAAAPPISGSAQVGVVIWSGHRRTAAQLPDFALAYTQSGAMLDAIESGGRPVGTGKPVTASYNSGTLTMTVAAADVGAGAGFDFQVGTKPDSQHVTGEIFWEDTAPDTGVWTYTMAKHEAAPSAPTVTAVSATFSSRAPQPGRTFTSSGLSLRLSIGEIVRVTAVTCTGKLGNLVLKGRGRGGCTFALPARAKRQELVVVTSGTYGSETVSSSDSFLVG